MFSTGALTQAVPGSNPAPAAQIDAPAASYGQPAEWDWSNATSAFFASRCSWLVLALLAIGLLIVWPRRRLAKEDVATFAEMLKSASQERKGATGA